MPPPPAPTLMVASWWGEGAAKNRDREGHTRFFRIHITAGKNVLTRQGEVVYLKLNIRRARFLAHKKVIPTRQVAN